MNTVYNGALARLQGKSMSDTPFAKSGIPNTYGFDEHGVNKEWLSWSNRWLAMNSLLDESLNYPNTPSFRQQLEIKISALISRSYDDGSIVSCVLDPLDPSKLQVEIGPGPDPFEPSKPKKRVAHNPPYRTQIDDWKLTMTDSECIFINKEFARVLSDHDFYYEDNFRAARLWKSSQMRRFRRLRNQGCCGSHEWVVKKWNWFKLRYDLYLLGFNYGH